MCPHHPLPALAALRRAPALMPRAEVEIEFAIEGRAIGFVLDQSGCQRFAQPHALQAGRRHRVGGVDRFRHRDSHSRLAQAGDESEQQLSHQ